MDGDINKDDLINCLSICQDCTHNTTGPHCDQCLPGFYGDATEGTADDCQLCPCPLTEPSNRFRTFKLYFHSINSIIMKNL